MARTVWGSKTSGLICPPFRFRLEIISGLRVCCSLGGGALGLQAQDLGLDGSGNLADSHSSYVCILLTSRLGSVIIWRVLIRLLGFGVHSLPALPGTKKVSSGLGLVRFRINPKP